MTIQERLDEAIAAIPPLPDVALRVLDVTADPEFAIADLVSLVRTDPGLTARVLRMCNSSLYSLPQEVRSVRDALGYLGSRALVRVVVASCAKRSFEGGVAAGPYAAEEILRRSVLHGFLAESLAKHSGAVDSSLAFTAGILHDIGRVAMSIAALKSGKQLVPGRKQSLPAFERSVFGEDHAQVGFRILEHWSVPAVIRGAVRDHHGAEDQALDLPLSAVLCASEMLTLEPEVRDANREELEMPFANALDALGISPDLAPSIRAEAEAATESMGRSLQMR
ncbi:MAG: HDOD domain-containing protein [Planctomycetota bacterium]